MKIRMEVFKRDSCYSLTMRNVNSVISYHLINHVRLFINYEECKYKMERLNNT